MSEPLTEYRCENISFRLYMNDYHEWVAEFSVNEDISYTTEYEELKKMYGDGTPHTRVITYDGRNRQKELAIGIAALRFSELLCDRSDIAPRWENLCRTHKGQKGDKN